MREEDKVIKVSNSLYERAKAIAEARGVNIGDAIVEAGQELAPSVSICEEEWFKDELRKVGVTPPTETKWLFGFLDNFTVEMLKGSKLSPYAEARAKAKAVCSLLPGAEEVIEASTKEAGKTEVVAKAEAAPAEGVETEAQPTEQSEPVAELEATEAESTELEATTPVGEATEPPEATEPD